MVFGIIAASSITSMFIDLPRKPEAVVAAQNTVDPFSSLISNMFQRSTPSCIHIGSCSYISLTRDRTSLAAAALFATIPMVYLLLNKTAHKTYAAVVAVLPICLGIIPIVNLFS